MRGLKPELNTALKNHLTEGAWAGLDINENRGILELKADISIFIKLMNYLKENSACSFNVLMDLTAVDYLHKRPDVQRFDLVYLLWSTASMQRVRVMVTAGVNEKIPTVSGIWKGANWPEREVYDLFGIEFTGHPVMERILMPENFRGHPLRKDFPLEGIGEDYLIESILIEPDSGDTGNKQGD